MEIKNPYICEFYQKYPSIDFDKANIMLVNFLKNLMNLTNENSSVSDPIETNCIPPKTILNNFINTYTENEVIKGELGEKKLEILLCKLYPCAEVSLNLDENLFCDFIIRQPNHTDILINNKITEFNVKTSDVDYFLQSCKQTKSNGLLISQHTGITGKNNFEIELLDGNVITYIHCAEYKEDIISMGFEIVSRVYDKIKLLNPETEISIAKEVLYEINKEYKVFLCQKSELQKIMKEYHIKVLNQLEDIKFNNLQSFLSTKILSTVKIGAHKCNICNFYTSNTLKGIAAHKRGCKKKYPI